MGVLVLTLVFSGASFKLQAQEVHVTHLYTDFNGFWSSGVDSKSRVHPNNHHNVLGFTYGGRTFSTGVDDAKLLGHAIEFTPMTFQSLPVTEIPITSGNSRFAQFGSMADGLLDSTDHTALPVDFPVKLNDVLNDGVNGLDISTGVTNMTTSNNQPVKMEYPFGSIIGLEEIGDGSPDIIISQIAQPIASQTDRIWFEDGAGNRVGHAIHIDQTDLEPLGTSRSDFFDPNTGEVTSNYINSPRDLRLSAYEASEFGLNQDNYLKARQLVYQLGGKSDVGFIAFNMRLFELLVANDDAATTYEGVSVEVDVLQNDRIPSRDENVPITIETAPKNGTASVVDSQVVYTPNPEFIGTDTFRYQICSAFLNSCHSATVRVQVGGADLRLRKELQNPYVSIGEVAEFLVEVNNQGPFDAIGTEVLERLPSGYDFISAEASTGSFESNTGGWYIGDLALGETAQLVVRARVLSQGNYTNTAEVSSKLYDENLDDNSSSATPATFPSISLSTDCSGGRYKSLLIDVEGIGPWNRQLAGGWTLHYSLNGKVKMLYIVEPQNVLEMNTSGTFQLLEIKDSFGRSIAFSANPETRIQISHCKIMVNPALPVKTM